jgi:hypothetical protein
MNGHHTPLCSTNAIERSGCDVHFYAQRQTRYFGAEHPSILMTMHNVRSFYADEGKVEEAEVLYCTALLGKLRVLSPKYISTLNTINNIGILYRYNGILV